MSKHFTAKELRALQTLATTRLEELRRTFQQHYGDLSEYQTLARAERKMFDRLFSTKENICTQ